MDEGKQLEESPVDGDGGQDSEELQTPVPGPEGEPTSEIQGEGQAPGLDAQIQKAVTEAESRLRAEYEGKGGHLAKLRQAKDRELAQVRRQMEQRQAMEAKQAQALMAKDPVQAARIYQQQLAEMQQQQQAASAWDQWSAWAQEQYEAAGFDPAEHAEEIAEDTRRLFDAALQGQDAGQAASWQFTQGLFQRRIDQEKEAASKAAKELDSLKESMPEMVERAIHKALSDQGLSPEPTMGSGERLSTAEEWESLGAGQQIQYGIREARKKMPKP